MKTFTPEEIAYKLNMTLSHIGGNTSCFMNYDCVRDLVNLQPGFFKTKKIRDIINKIDEKKSEWDNLCAKYENEARELRKETELALKEKFGFSEPYQIVESLKNNL